MGMRRVSNPVWDWLDPKPQECFTFFISSASKAFSIDWNRTLIINQKLKYDETFGSLRKTTSPSFTHSLVSSSSSSRSYRVDLIQYIDSNSIVITGVARKS